MTTDWLSPSVDGYFGAADSPIGYYPISYHPFLARALVIRKTEQFLNQNTHLLRLLDLLADIWAIFWGSIHLVS